MKRTVSLLLTGAMALSLTSCGGGSASSAPNETGTPPSSAAPAASQDLSADPSEVQIGILIPGSPTDGGFCQQGAEAGEKLKELGYQVSVVEAATAEEIRSEAENMAAEGYQIVFGHGAQSVTPIAEVSPDYPDTWFVTLGGEVVTDNQFPVCVCAEESCYVLGVVAGMMSKTGTISYTLGGDYPSYVKYTNALKLGAQSVDPDIKALGAVLSSTSASECYETTLNQIEQGADFVFGNCNEGQLGAIKAAQESDGVYILGCLGDFSNTAPDKVVANMVCDYSVGYVQAVEAILSGNAPHDIMMQTIATGCVGFVWNDALKDSLPDGVVDAAEQALEDIRTGKIDVPNEYELDPNAPI
ncbi:BMP family protein [Pseudoflavonifractor sp. MSJ-37]|uniref:BMP family protein n=1 Tax=Pseudoflavonifractor sp. MSJ-37 TaxID=2841531 RepID=UPI001C101379|nr:BMP family protein [Pseudoflavonifractor sp. MSJ-37]MBU5434130.1 BMP family protein [Pseudoflavonifractor sp. MSJ-37]